MFTPYVKTKKEGILQHISLIHAFLGKYSANVLSIYSSSDNFKLTSMKGVIYEGDKSSCWWKAQNAHGLCNSG